MSTLVGLAKARRHEGTKAFAFARSRNAYIMLETVIAVALLIVGLTVIGAQIQDADSSIHKTRQKMRAVFLAEQQLAYMDMGLVKLDSVDEIQDGDFGPRFPDWGWRLVTQPTSLDGMFRLELEVLYLHRDKPYQKDSFEHDQADSVYRAYAFRVNPTPLDLAADFGMTETELTDFQQKVTDNGVPGFENGAFDPSLLATMDSEDLMKALSMLPKLFPGMDISELQALIPPEVLDQLKAAGLLEGFDSAGDGKTGGGQTGGEQPGGGQTGGGQTGGGQTGQPGGTGGGRTGGPPSGQRPGGSQSSGQTGGQRPPGQSSGVPAPPKGTKP